jgi:M6 family metalloprotease-like protein
MRTNPVACRLLAGLTLLWPASRAAAASEGDWTREPGCADRSASQDLASATVLSIPRTGTIRMPVIFVKFADDDFFNTCPGTVDGWPPAEPNKPGWASSFIDDQYSPDGSYTDGSLSDYFYEMSFGRFHMVGDVFPTGPEAWVPLDDDGNPAPQSYFHRNTTQPPGSPSRRGMGYLIRKILVDLDDQIDFSQYDNNPQDGVVDSVAVVFREFDMGIVGCYQTYSGNAVLDPCFDGFFPLTLDGVRIESYLQGWHQRHTYYLDETRELAAHEAGHLLRGGGHDDGLGSWGYGDGRPVGRGARDKLMLGWATATDVVATRAAIPLPELQSSPEGTILRVGPYLVENRQRSRYEQPFVGACGGVGGTPGTGALITVGASVKPADRLYKFPGDAGDAWSPLTQVLFSPWSNPADGSGGSYAVQVADAAGSLRADVWVGDASQAPPSEVAGLQVTGAIGSSPSLSWLANREPDLVGYHVYRNRGTGFSRITSQPLNATSYVDTALVVTNPPFVSTEALLPWPWPFARRTYYLVLAVDSQGLLSPLAGADVRGGLWTRFRFIDLSMTAAAEAVTRSSR